MLSFHNKEYVLLLYALIVTKVVATMKFCDVLQSSKNSPKKPNQFGMIFLIFCQIAISVSLKKFDGSSLRRCRELLLRVAFL